MRIIEYSKKPNKHSYQSCVDNYVNTINIYRNNLFSYTPPVGIDKNQVENGLQYGIACLYKCPVSSSVNYNKWCCTQAFPASLLDNNGVADKVTTFGSDYGVELKVDDECVLLYNNSTKTYNDIIERYSHLLNEIDITIETVIKWCRLVPIPKVHSDADIAKYTTVMRNILRGDLVNVVSDSSYLLSSDSPVKDDLLELTDVNASEKLHFLSEFREEVIKRLAGLYGIPFNTTAKSAQALNAELHGMDVYSLFNIFDMYQARKESFERAEKFTNHKWNFDFSELMKHQINDIMNHTNDSKGVGDNESTEIENNTVND